MPHSLRSKVKNLCYKGEITEKERDRIIQALEKQPGEDCISRTKLLSRIDAERKHLLDLKMDGAEHVIVHHARRIIEDMPSVTPKPCEEENPNCTECRYYDKEKYHCPRFCRVIESTMAEITSEQTRWIPCSEKMPDINIHVLAQFVMGGMTECYYAHNWWHIVGGFRISGDEVIAWMPLPTSYQGEENG